MIIQEDVYLEHFGVKGMHWGSRKARTSEPRKGFSGKQKAAIGAAGVVAVTAGALAINHVLAKHGAEKLASEHFQRVSENGFAWKTANGPWTYSVPKGAFPSAMSKQNKADLASKVIKKSRFGSRG